MAVRVLPGKFIFWVFGPFSAKTWSFLTVFQVFSSILRPYLIKYMSKSPENLQARKKSSEEQIFLISGHFDGGLLLRYSHFST